MLVRSPAWIKTCPLGSFTLVLWVSDMQTKRVLLVRGGDCCGCEIDMVSDTVLAT